jgi:hypothetical protein
MQDQDWLAGLWFIFLVVLGIAQLAATYVGIDDLYGPVWACLAIVVAMFFRLIIIIAVGAFIGAMNVWDWHWSMALLFTFPTLIIIVPGLLIALIEGITKWRAQ